MHGPVIQRCLRKLRLLIVAIHFVQIGEVVQLKGIKQRKYGSIDLKMMPISLSVRKGQPVAAVPGRADGIGIVFVLPSFRMVSIHDIFLRFDLNFGNSNRDGGLRQPTLSLKKRRYSKTHLQSGRSRKASAFNSLLK